MPTLVILGALVDCAGLADWPLEANCKYDLPCSSDHSAPLWSMRRFEGIGLTFIKQLEGTRSLARASYPLNLTLWLILL